MGKVITVFTNGFPGAISRAVDDVVVSFASRESSADIAFGAPVMISTDALGVVNFTTTIASDADTTAQIHGIAVRTAKTPDTYGSNVASYHPGEHVDVLTNGSCVVHVASGSPKPGAKVYWTSAGFTATYTQHAVAEITNMHFKSGKDSNGNAEVLISPRII